MPPQDVRDMYNAGRGDMFYGIGEQINHYLEVVLGRDLTRREAMRLKQEEFAAINTYNTAIRGADYALGGTTIAVTNPATPATDIGDYARSLIAHRKYAPSTVAGDVTANPRLLAALRKGQITLDQHSPSLSIRAAAKELAI